MTAAVFAVPDLMKIILEQKADLFSHGHGSGHVGQETLCVWFYFLLAHSNGPQACVIVSSFSQVSKITSSFLIPTGRTTTVPASLSCHPCFLGSQATHKNPKHKGIAEI
jgi:hypothetical protein